MVEDERRAYSNIDIIVDGLMLLHDFSFPVTTKIVVDSISKPFVVENLQQFPTWEYVQNFIERRPELLYTRDFQEAWEKRDEAAIYQQMLINCFMDVIRGKSYLKIYPYGEKLPPTSEISRLIMNNLSQIVDIINKKDAKREEKIKRLYELFGKAEQK